MPRFVQVSDIHLQPGAHAPVLEALGFGLERAALGSVDAIFVTGDVFDTVGSPEDLVRTVFADLLTTMRRSLGFAGPIVVLPGNHDRRHKGLLGPADDGLVALLHVIADGGAHGPVTVVGRDPLRSIALLSVAGFPVVAHDSTFLPGGKVSAGGTLRAEDLLEAGALLEGIGPDVPILWLTHHHLIPTPITDVGITAVSDLGGPGAWLAERGLSALRWLVSYGDREELFMTALGAGSALSLLHALGRPIVTLHGHKHYPTARLSQGTAEADGDVLLVAAGSAGLFESWRLTDDSTPLRLWPSFNVVDVDATNVAVTTHAFSAPKSVVERTLVRARRTGHRWAIEGVAPARSEPVLAESSSAIALVRGGHPDEWDLDVERRLTLRSDAVLHGKPIRTLSIEEPIFGLDQAEWSTREGPRSRASEPPCVELEAGVPRTLVYRVHRALTATRAHALQAYGEPTPFEWVALPHRYGADRATLTLSGPASVLDGAFGSATDLATGRQVPRALVRREGRVELTLSPCPARTLLRIHWRLGA